MSRTVTNEEFTGALQGMLQSLPARPASVTGPGRSGALAAVYASHMLGVPFLPFGQPGPGPVLVVDTARSSGRTLRRAVRRYEGLGMAVTAIAVFEEPPRVRFWYERGAEPPSPPEKP